MAVSAVMFSSSRSDWGTPPEVFEPLNDEFAFDVDVAADASNAKVGRYFSAADDGLSQDWAGLVCWCNPPYGRHWSRWVAKAIHEARRGATTVLLLPARTDTRAFHRYLWDARTHAPRPGIEVRFLPGRIRFEGAAAGAPFPSMVVVVRPGS